MKQIIVSAVTALVVSVVVVLVGGNQSASLGATGTRFPNGISADSTSPSAGQVRGATLTMTGDATVGGGTLNVTTANTATSTGIVGCIQTYATSTASPVKFVLSPFIGTSTPFDGGSSNFLVAAQFGTCPNL